MWKRLGTKIDASERGEETSRNCGIGSEWRGVDLCSGPVDFGSLERSGRCCLGLVRGGGRVVCGLRSLFRRSAGEALGSGYLAGAGEKGLTPDNAL